MSKTLEIKGFSNKSSMSEKLDALEFNLNVSRVDRIDMPGGNIFTEEIFYLKENILLRMKKVFKDHCD